MCARFYAMKSEDCEMWKTQNHGRKKSKHGMKSWKNRNQDIEWKEKYKWDERTFVSIQDFNYKIRRLRNVRLSKPR